MSYDEEADWAKTVGQYRLRVGSALSPLRKYGQSEYVTGVTEELVQLAIQLHYKLSGVDMPFNIEEIHW